jgi:hypothetical protein
MKAAIAVRNEFKGFRLPTYDEVCNTFTMTSGWNATLLIDYQITYNGQTYRVVSNAGNATTVSNLSGYQLVLSNFGATLNGSSCSIAQNGVAVFKK